MILISAIIGISFISVLWAWFSLKNEMKKTTHAKEVRKKLEKGRVLFYNKKA